MAGMRPETISTILVCIMLFSVLSLLAPGCDVMNQDLESPTNPSVSINDGETTTYEQKVQLSLSCEDNVDVDEMRISNSPDFVDADWEAYYTPVKWTLTDGYGNKTVYVQFRDMAENVSDVASTSIMYSPYPSTLPNEPGIIINDGGTYTTKQMVQLSLSCKDDNGIVNMRISNYADFSGASWETYITSKSWALSDGFGHKTVHAQFMDGDGNISEAVAASIDFIDAVILRVSPAAAQVTVGGALDVDVYAEGAVQIVSAHITISFNPIALEVMKIKTSGNGFLLTDAGANVITAESDYDNINGLVVFGVLGQESGFTGASGDGTLARITFKGKAAGSSDIKFIAVTENDFILYRYALNEKGFEKYNARISDGVISVK